MTAEFRFNPEDHSYWLGERRLPSVTQILDACGLIYHASPEALERGQRVHEACALMFRRRLDWSSIDDRILPWVESACGLQIEHFGSIVEIETPHYDKFLDLAGTPDLVTKNFILDFKSGPPASWHNAQLGGYWRLLGERHRLIGVYLQEDGTIPKLCEYRASEAWREFLTCFNFYQLREKYGRNGKFDNP